MNLLLYYKFIRMKDHSYFFHLNLIFIAILIVYLKVIFLFYFHQFRRYLDIHTNQINSDVIQNKFGN